MSLNALPESHANHGVRDKEYDDISAPTSGSRWSCWFCGGHSQETTASTLIHITLAAAPLICQEVCVKLLLDFHMLAYPKEPRDPWGIRV